MRVGSHAVLVFAQGALAAVAMPGAGRLATLSPVVAAITQAAVAALVVWLVGLVGSFLLKIVRRPTFVSLVGTMLGAFGGLAAGFALPDLFSGIVALNEAQVLAVAGAIAGYLLVR